jgi:PAS domain S-box-containing protein
MIASVEKKIGLGFLASVAALLGISLLSYQTIKNSITAQAWVTHTYTVITQLEHGEAILTRAETEQRAYLLTGEDAFLQDSQDAQSQVKGWFAEVGSLISDNPEEEKRLDELKPLIAQRLDFLNNRIEVRRTQGLQAAADAVATREGDKLSQVISRRIDAMHLAEVQLLQKRQQAQLTDAHLAAICVIGGGILACVLGLIAISMIHRDLKEQGRIAGLLEHERHLLKQLMENATENIYFKDTESRFIRINRNHAKKFGLDDPAKAIGKSDADFFSGEHVREARQDEEEIMRTGKPISKEEQETWPDGRVTWVLTVKVPLRDSSGKIIGTFGLSRDITGRKVNEQQIKKLNDDLLLRSGQLESVNKELEAFSYSVSHDLRAPLRHIDGFVKLLDKSANSNLDERGRRYLEIIADSARRMGTLIDDLLVFSRMGRMELHCANVEPDALIHEVMETLQDDMKDRKIEWKIAKLPQVRADLAMLRQVWANLIGNAVKYSRPRDPAIIEIGCNESDAEFVFYVRDNGVGFDMQYAHKLYGVFQRLHRVEEFEGTGIGLANVQRIVLRHHGRVWAESKLNEGSTFFFAIPKQTIETKG